MKDVPYYSISMNLIISIEDINKQGESLSLLLFNIIMNEILKEIKVTRGYIMGSRS